MTRRRPGAGRTRAGRDALRDFELAEVGDVTGRRLVHLYSLRARRPE